MPINSFRRYRQYRQTVAELNKLSDRELSDIGLLRSDIRGIAKRHTR